MNRAREYVRERFHEELTPPMARVLAEADTDLTGFGLLGIDGEGRVVSYWDDGTLTRKPLEDGELAERGHPEYVSTFLGASPHDGEGAVLALDTDDWNWLHPRYRWLTEDGDLNLNP